MQDPDVELTQSAAKSISSISTQAWKSGLLGGITARGKYVEVLGAISRGHRRNYNFISGFHLFILVTNYSHNKHVFVWKHFLHPKCPHSRTSAYKSPFESLISPSHEGHSSGGSMGHGCRAHEPHTCDEGLHRSQQNEHNTTCPNGVMYGMEISLWILANHRNEFPECSRLFGECYVTVLGHKVPQYIFEDKWRRVLPAPTGNAKVGVPNVGGDLCVFTEN